MKFDILMREDEFADIKSEQLIYESVSINEVKKLVHRGVPDCSDITPQGRMPKVPCIKCFMTAAINRGLSIGRAVGFKQ